MKSYYFLFVIVFLFFISYIWAHYVSDNDEFMTSSLSNQHLSDQLFTIINTLQYAKNKKVIFLEWNRILFDDRITKLFVQELPKNVQDIKIQCNSIDDIYIPDIRNLFTFNYNFVLFILKQLPILLNGCIAIDLSNANQYKKEITDILSELSFLPILLFGKKEIPLWLKDMKNIFLSSLQSEEENFIAFTLCNFKILTSDIFFMSAWIDIRYNSKVNILHQSKFISPIHWSLNNIQKFGGILVFDNSKQLLILCEAFRRIYPHSKLKIIVKPGQQIIQSDIEFFRAEITYGYSNLKEFLDFISDFTELELIFLKHENQFIYPIIKSEINTSFWQLLKNEPLNQPRYLELEKKCLSFLS